MRRTLLTLSLLSLSVASYTLGTSREGISLGYRLSA